MIINGICTGQIRQCNLSNYKKCVLTKKSTIFRVCFHFPERITWQFYWWKCVKISRVMISFRHLGSCRPIPRNFVSNFPKNKTEFLLWNLKQVVRVEEYFWPGECKTSRRWSLLWFKNILINLFWLMGWNLIWGCMFWWQESILWEFIYIKRELLGLRQRIMSPLTAKTWEM